VFAVKLLVNGINLFLHLLDSYTDPPFAALSKLFGDPIRYRVLLPYKEESVPPEYRIFDQLGGLDMFKLLIRPKHLSMLYEDSMKIQRLRFLYKDSNGWLRNMQIEVKFDEAPSSVFVMFKHIGINMPYNLQTADHYWGLVSPNGSPNQELVKRLGQYMKMSISF
jgi:hypothetical protein